MKRGVDFDGTLAEYEKWEGADVLGAPIPVMVKRVKGWLAQGDDVVVVTARAHPEHGDEAEIAIDAIRQWCVDNLGQELEVTCMKDSQMDEIWDDRGVRVETNTGMVSPQTDIMMWDADPEADSIGEFLGG